LRRVESRLDEEVRALRETQGLLAVDEESRVQALIAVNRRLQELALTDELTGLYNHRFFHRRLKEEVGRSQRLSLPLSLLFADIDHFKRVNDAHGHPNGDRVLRHVATLLRDGVEGAGVYARLRRSDVVTRYGGEEFAVLLMDARTEGAASVAERIRSAVAATPAVLPDGTQASVTLSLGVASIPYNAVDADELVRVADQALYRAKSSGRNRVETSPLRATPAVG
jgi:diguanylate cyclase (GGDEF)-like protein